MCGWLCFFFTPGSAKLPILSSIWAFLWLFLGVCWSAPQFSVELLTLCIPAGSRRSSGGAFLVVDKWRLRLKVSRLLSGHPRLWNDLPEDKRLPGLVNSPKSLLKSHFYVTCYHHFMWSFVSAYNIIIPLVHFGQETCCHSFWLFLLLWWRCSSLLKHLFFPPLKLSRSWIYPPSPRCCIDFTSPSIHLFHPPHKKGH